MLQTARMEKFIKVTSHQIPLFGSTLESDQEMLLNEIERLRAELDLKEKIYKENEATLKQLGIKKKLNGDAIDFVSIESNFKGIKTKKLSVTDYKSDLSAWNKVRYFLNYENKALSGREIIEAIYSKEQELKSAPREIKKRTEDNVFAILNKNIKTGNLVRFKKANESGYKYGFKDWFDGDVIKKEYLV